MANKHVKRGSTLICRRNQFKITMRFNYISTRMAKILLKADKELSIPIRWNIVIPMFYIFLMAALTL